MISANKRVASKIFDNCFKWPLEAIKTYTLIKL